MKKKTIIFIIFVLLLSILSSSEHTYIALEAENPIRQNGSQGKDEKIVASGGEVLGCEFGSQAGHYAEYEFELKENLDALYISIRYARALNGYGWLDVAIDNEFAGRLQYSNTGGWGNKEQDYKWSSLYIPKLRKGKHLLRLTVMKIETKITFPQIPIPRSPILDIIGNRNDKNCVGHGKNVALYTGIPSKFYYATHKLGNIFDIVDGTTINWFPDHILVTPDVNVGNLHNINIDRIIISKDKKEQFEKQKPKIKLKEQRQICVTQNDVIVSVIHLHNPTTNPIIQTIEVSGDCTNSKDWRGKVGSEKITQQKDNFIILKDKNVFPNILADGLTMAIGGNIEPNEIICESLGTYKLKYQVEIPPDTSLKFTFACAINPDEQTALENLNTVLEKDNPITMNRTDWQNFFENVVPHFSCSDKGLEELYGFRWFLLKFSTAGGDLGFFKYPVVMEGRQAYQTYCCYSAPFMALDMNWANDEQVGFGHIHNMIHSAYEDGRFPWYTSPRTNRVKLHHKSKTGLSLLPYTAWQHYLIHGNKKMLAELYPGMKKNVQWWIADRDADGDGLFVIDHQLETGMDDLSRFDDNDPKLRYDAIDATSYAYANMLAISNMARILGKSDDENFFQNYADKTKKAVNLLLWNAENKSYRDRHPTSKKLSQTMCITTFYPFFTGIGTEQNLDVFTKHLLNPAQFGLPYPVPALPKDDPNFNPTGFWEGPSWPAATSHILDAFAISAKTLDRSLLPDAAELIKLSTKKHLQSRADFFERYNPLTGEPLSHFRDYMHSWWIDIIIRHIVGFEPQENGHIELDPLPMELDYFLLENVNYQGKDIKIVWQSPDIPKEYEKYPAGYSVYVDGKIIHNDEKLERWVEGK
ncbi:MAG: hypothetical protein K8S23_07570 [Candidatus Cloacimonetes bacterium]|nr:hypothetical protein [Candidatus Cloacimonadota bacterium]